MKLKNLFHISVIIFLLFNSCIQKKVKENVSDKLSIRLSADSTSLELSGLPTYVLEEFIADSLENSHWINFFAAYEEPKDAELRDFQPPLEGTYSIEEGLVRFRPAQNFGAPASYFARCYTKMLLQDGEDLIEKHELFSTEGFAEYKFNISKQ
ncbi:MAG: hypothetical protein WC220_06055 [Pedobacter sp.]|jgi:hypothetical protein